MQTPEQWVAELYDISVPDRDGEIVLGHSFQFMLTPRDQLQTLETFQRHLEPGGRLVIHLDHQNVDRLCELRGDLGGKFVQGKDVRHPQSQRVDVSTIHTDCDRGQPMGRDC